MQPLKDVVDLKRGFDLPHHARRMGPYPVLSSGLASGWHDEGPVEGPGMVIGRATNLGRPTWSDGAFWPHNTTLYVADFKGNVKRWVFYLFESLDLSGFNSGSVQPMLNRNYIANVQVPLPPTGTQEAIAEVLGALDDKIAANDITSATSSELLRHAYALAVSQNAQRINFLEAVKVEFGEAFKGESFSEPGVGRPLIRIRDLRTSKPKTWTIEHRSVESLVRRGDVLVGMDAEFRPTAWVGDEGVLNQRVCRMSHASTGQAYLREAIKAPLAHIESYKTGTTVSHLNKSDLAAAEVLVLAEPAQRAFRARNEGTYRAEVAAAHENQSLAALRDTLLPALMSGRLRVRDAEKAVEGVL